MPPRHGINISVYAAAAEAAARCMRKARRIIHYAVSRRRRRWLVCWLRSEAMNCEIFSLAGRSTDAYRDCAGENALRLSVGLEDGGDLIADIERVLCYPRATGHDEGSSYKAHLELNRRCGFASPRATWVLLRPLASSGRTRDPRR